MDSAVHKTGEKMNDLEVVMNNETRNYKFQRMDELSKIFYSIYICEQKNVIELIVTPENGTLFCPPVDEYEVMAILEQKRLLELKYEDGGEVL